MKKLDKTAAMIRLTFLQKLMYSKAVWFDVFGTMVAVCIYYFLWKIIFQGRSEMAGFTMPQITTYVILSKILSAQFSGGINQTFAEWIYDGSIGTELLRPMTLMHTLFGMRVGEFCFFVIFKGVPVVLISSMLFHGALPAGAWQLLLFVLSVFISVGIMFHIELFVGMLCFYTLNHYGITFTKRAVLSLLSGGIVPLFLFPSGIEKVLNLLPFAGMVSVPLNILLGKYGLSEAGGYILIQCFWVAALYILSHRLYGHVIKKVVVQGG